MQVFDAGEVFQIQMVQNEEKENQSWKVVVSCEEGIKCIDSKQLGPVSLIYIFNHLVFL